MERATPHTEGNTSIHLGPIEQGGPDSLLHLIIDLIGKARRRQKLMIAVQEIENLAIVEAIVIVIKDAVVANAYAKSSGIDDALMAAADRGVTVNGVLDRRQANQRWAATRPLAQAGVNIRLAGNSGGLGKLHHKLMTIDDAVTIFGSFNYTGPANLCNDENILVVGDVQETAQSAKAAQRRISRACRAEIERIASTFGTPL